MSRAPGSRWWRRNWWGLVAAVPLMAVLVLVSPDQSLDRLRNAHTEEVVRPDANGWVSYGGARLRLTGFGPADLRDGDGLPLSTPGLRAWQVTLTVQADTDPSALPGCTIELEDPAGLRYREGPQALAAAYDTAGSGLYAASCSPPYDQPNQAAPFEVVGYFLLPEDTAPVALRVSNFVQEPAYVRIGVG